MFLVYHGYWL